MRVAVTLRSLAGGILTAVVLTPGLAPATSSVDDAAQRIVHVLDYIAVDYEWAFEDGSVVDELEYREQLEFASSVDEALAGLGVASDALLGRDLAALQAAIQAKRPAVEVARGSRALARSVREEFDLHTSPPRTPSLERGEAVYARACASCHEAKGRGDGPAAREMTPPPSSLRDRERMLALSLFDLYSTISHGIDGTAMRGFAGELSEAERYAAKRQGGFPSRGSPFLGSNGSASDPPQRSSSSRAYSSSWHSERSHGS